MNSLAMLTVAFQTPGNAMVFGIAMIAPMKETAPNHQLKRRISVSRFCFFYLFILMHTRCLQAFYKTPERNLVSKMH